MILTNYIVEFCLGVDVLNSKLKLRSEHMAHQFVCTATFS